MALIQPDEQMQVLIRKELNEDPAARDQHLEHIKEWLTKQPHLPDSWDEHRILTFLRGCNFSLERTKKKLDMYFTMRTACPELFTNRDVTRPEIQEIVKNVNIPALPGLTPNGRRVICFRGLDSSVTHPSIYDAFKVVLMMGDIRLEAEQTGVAGDVYILDAKVVSAAHFSKITPSVAKKFLVIVQEAYPVKLKEVHVINISPIVDTIVNWVKPFLSEKIRNRIFIHNDLESLYKMIPKDMLPEEYGGKAGKLQDLHDQWIEKMKEYTPWFAAQETIKADEAKRPGKPTNLDDLFGVDGSFKQLNID